MGTVQCKVQHRGAQGAAGLPAAHATTTRQAGRRAGAPHLVPAAEGVEDEGGEVLVSCQAGLQKGNGGQQRRELSSGPTKSRRLKAKGWQGWCCDGGGRKRCTQFLTPWHASCPPSAMFLFKQAAEAEAEAEVSAPAWPHAAASPQSSNAGSALAGPHTCRQRNGGKRSKGSIKPQMRRRLSDAQAQQACRVGVKQCGGSAATGN